MRILIASQTYDLHTNGQGVFAVHLAEGLVEAGEQVMVLMPSDRFSAYQTTRNGVLIRAITALSLSPLYDDVHVTPFPGPQIVKWLQEFQPDVIHIQDHYPLCSAVVDAASQRDLPIVGTNHFLPDNIIMNVELFNQFHDISQEVLWKTVLRVYNRLTLTTAPTETAVHILEQNGLQTPARAVSCGVDLNRFRPDPEIDIAKLRKRYHIDPDKIVFLYVGRLDLEKRLDVLLHALKQSGRTDIQIAIAGHGERKKVLLELVEELALDSRVVFTGYVPDEDLPKLYNSVDYFAMPSEAELQSIATLEAMGTGRPVLAANARALPELVKHKINGYLFQCDDPADAAKGLEWLADQKPNWQALSQASLEIVSKHDIQRTIRRYQEIYRTLADR
jgi:1,2-diacylglycerol 3-alpha-glucosyltransferase